MPDLVHHAMMHEKYRIVRGSHRQHRTANPDMATIVQVRADPAFQLVAETGIAVHIPWRRVIRRDAHDLIDLRLSG